MLEEKENRLSEMVSCIMENLGTVLDTNTVVGKPVITMDGSTIIPISKVTVGFVCGGGEYGDVKFLKFDEPFPFAGGNGAILSMKPSGFLVDCGQGLKFVNATNQPVERLFDSASEFLINLSKEKGENR